MSNIRHQVGARAGGGGAELRATHTEAASLKMRLDVDRRVLPFRGLILLGRDAQLEAGGNDGWFSLAWWIQMGSSLFRLSSRWQDGAHPKTCCVCDGSLM